MPFMKEDLIESLLVCLPELVAGIQPGILASFLKESGRDLSLAKEKLISEAREDRMLLEMLGIIWVDSHPALWARIGLSSVKRIKETMDDLAQEYGPTNLRIALLQDDRQTVRDLGMRRRYRIPAELHPDKGFPLSDGNQEVTISIRKIAEAVDSNDLQTVAFVRRALARLKTGRQSILKNLAALDASCVEALNHIEKPVLVDGSNVAWDGQQMPRLANIISLRDELRRTGYFPIYIYVDAALIYQIDQGMKLEELINKSCVIAADSGSAADEAIIRHAIRLNCPVITNDRMLEWDPEGEVTKYKFAFDAKGVTIYDG
ncbi:MAG TPA: hypothetical protein VFI02_15605 [Armatimonadota bacterium]|nr:hypothetical protein [Armatimonadota bacterium]